jgi:hypothetical protein
MILSLIEYDEGERDPRRRGGEGWTVIKFSKAHEDILKSILGVGVTKDQLITSYKNFYHDKRNEEKKAIKQFLVNKGIREDQELNYIRLAFRNGTHENDINGFLRFQLENACNTNPIDKFVNYFSQNEELINIIIRKFILKMSLNTDEDAVVCTLIIPTECKYIDRCLLFLYNCNCNCNIIITHSVVYSNS